MRTWTTTSWYYNSFDQVHTQQKSDTKKWPQGIWEINNYSPDYDKLKVALTNLQSYCNKNQFGVKSIIPLTAAKTYEYGQVCEYTAGFLGSAGVTSAAGVGYGWAYSNVIGFAALLEKVEHISEEEYQRRISDVENSPSLVPA